MDVCDAARVVQPADTGEGGRRGLCTQWYPQGQSECVVGGDWRRDQGLGYRGPLKEGGLYDLDFDHQFIEAEKFDSKPTFKKFLGYRPGVAVIGDTIVGIENSDGNTNVRFHRKDTLKRFFERLEQRGLAVNRFRADCGSCSEDIVSEVEKHCKSFYIRANRCSSLYDDIFALRGWSKEAINGIDFELNSILVEKWKGKAYRLVIQRQKRLDGDLDL